LKVTNKHNVPETLVALATRDYYSKGKADYSVTEIISPPRIQRLRRQYNEQMEQDVSDMLWQLLGSALHVVAERGVADGHITEERLITEIDGVKLSGAIDIQKVESDGIIITDYKFTSAWALRQDKPEWEAQQNIYAWLVEKVKDVKVTKLEIVAIIRDWSRRDAAIKQGYPDAPIKVIPIQLWPFETRQKFIEDRITEHSNALFELETGDELPLCTPEQMWEKQTTYAVKKIGGVKARNVCPTQEEADAKIAEYGAGYEVEVRKGERTRCANFCAVRDFCSQWREYELLQQQAG